MKKFFPITNNALYTTDFYKDPGYNISKVMLVGSTLRDTDVTNMESEIIVNYGTMGNSTSDNEQIETASFNFQTPPVLDQLVEVDITNAIIPHVTSDPANFFTLTINTHSYFRFTLLCFELAPV